MRAAVLRHAGLDGIGIRDDVETVAVSDVLVRVRVRAAGVCHSDLSAATGRLGLAPPVVLGHEAAGEVVEVGDQVRDFEPGDRVMVSWVPQCGSCPCCLRGQPELCGYALEPGYRRPRFLVGSKPVAAQAGCGAFAEEVVVTQHNLVRLPDGVPYEIGALVSCGVSTGVGAVLNTAELAEGATAVVIGCGGVGMSIVQAARAAGAATVVAVDPVPAKRELARTLGASIAAAPAELAEHLPTAGGEAGFDVAFEAVGLPETIRSAYDATRRGGTTVIVGVGAAEATVPFSARELYASGRRLVGSVFGSCDIHRDFPRNIELWRKGELELEALISDRIGLTDLPDALRALRSGSALRSVVIF
ncbi:alcohol dehydrogenase catalytic domain-containing protein [Amycolatopsis cihanbeyliensis]|uniref:S-(Hydroxymethyl)glutathione dehydrogenase/alcohol dehydrogenase n=1 Tax=Amycolatopsis cihanbeyliensis TaxID=1128664 RepID=A0A542DFX1_AMYCI|nr:alcohol dehydrogenase catalytic domain-containing protein [Amycolatopsis cihanbeyliensis]TQJ01988.1 S-(hydroxymethyl)glutathione dehydrogenase/alcohol dehydrogenase [Amycolatopsis cihanbeyliensis]